MNWQIVLMLLSGCALVCGCPSEGSGFASSNDDDDATGDDDDGAGPMIGGLVFDLSDSSGPPAVLPGAAIHVIPVGPDTTTRESGAYDLPLDGDPLWDISASSDGLVDQVTFIDTASQTTPEQGVVHSLAPLTLLDDLHTQIVGTGFDGAKAALAVAVTPWDDVTQPLVGAQVTIDVNRDGSVLMPGTPEAQPTPGDTLTADSSAVLFLNVDAGPLEITVTTPGSETCEGRMTVDLPSNVLGSVTIRCQ
jgi:hypothetical protein